MGTKRLLVPFDPARPEWNPREFLIPIIRNGKLRLVGLKKGSEFELGSVVFIGRSIDERELFDALVDSGLNLETPEQDEVAILAQYVAKVRLLRLGNVARLKSTESGFELDVVAKTPWSYQP